MPSTTSPLATDVAATPVAVAPGGTIVLRGQFTSSANAMVLDACQAGGSEGPAREARGLIDYEAGGWQLQSRDWTAHSCRLVATGGPAPACSALGIAAPCLPSRIDRIAHQLPVPATVEEFRSGLVGGMQLEVLSPAEAAVGVPPPPPSWARTHGAGLGGAALAIVLAIVGVGALRRRGRAPESLVRKAAARVRSRLRAGDPVYKRLAPLVDDLARQAGELAALRDRLRGKFIAADRPALVRRRDELASRAAVEASEARALVDERLARVDRWRDESERASARLDRVLEYLQALDARFDDEIGGRTGVRVEEDARLLKDLERDVEAALDGAREADRLAASVSR